MIANKHISKIIAAVMAIAVLLCFCAMAFSSTLVSAAGGTGVTMEYESKLFDTSTPLEINIVMSDWDDMLANAMSETYYRCDVEINGKTIRNVGIRPKGNTSLSAIATNADTDRYSLKLEFDQYVKGQTCYGLDKLALNNNYADATNMKEALIYDMYASLDTDASLYNYATISVNGEYWGVYLAVEAVEDSFLLRNYGTQAGDLYKPESMGMGGGDKAGNLPDNADMADFDPSQHGGGKADFDPSQFGGDMADFDPSQFGGDKADFDPTQGGGDMPGGFSMGGSGSNLNYTDDALDSYSTIWDGEVTGSSKQDHRRVVTALKHISEGTDLETYMDIDNLLKYMAVHVFSVNDDSLTGSMAHNYYLYEYNGRLNLIPWDYNLAFGGMGSGNDATSTVNDAIDGAFTGTTFFDALMENETYRNQYHAYLRQLAEEYVDGGGFEAFYNRTRSKIDSLVETDPTAFYTYEEYLDAADMLCEIISLRAASIAGQVDGTIPSTAQEQRSSDALLDASQLDLSVMGVMDMGGGMGGGPKFGNRGDQTTDGQTTDGQTAALDAAVTASATGDGATLTLLSSTGGTKAPPSGGQMPDGFDPSQMQGDFDPSQVPSDFDPSQAPGDFDPSQGSQGGTGEQSAPAAHPDSAATDDTEATAPADDATAPDITTDAAPDTTTDADTSATTNAATGDTQSGRGGMQGFDPAAMDGASSAAQTQNAITFAACFVLLLLALLVATLYRRKPR